MLRRTGTLAGARFALTDRTGGVSRAPYDALNLGDHVGDDPDAVADNRRRVAVGLDLDPAALVFMEQVHGREVAVIDGPQQAGDPPVTADALVTRAAGLGLVVLVADCVPVLLAGPADDGSGQTVAGVVHAGRKGVELGVVAATLRAMAVLGAHPHTLRAVIGPAVCGRCYEVSDEMATTVVAAEPATRARTRAGSPALDLRAGVLAQLVDAGVRTDAVDIDPWCTYESPELFSFRRNHRTGRFAGVVLT